MSACSSLFWLVKWAFFWANRSRFNLRNSVCNFHKSPRTRFPVGSVRPKFKVNTRTLTHLVSSIPPDPCYSTYICNFYFVQEPGEKIFDLFFKYMLKFIDVFSKNFKKRQMHWLAYKRNFFAMIIVLFNSDNKGIIIVSFRRQI